MNIVSYNCYNFKSNTLMIKNLIDSNHICYFIEHWLGNEEAYLFNQLCNHHSIIFNSDFINADRDANNKRGRPFGGRCWVISNELRLIEHVELSQCLSKITVEGHNVGRTSIYGIWQPFDNGSNEKLAILHSTLSILEVELTLNGNDALIIGDFNRLNRFDILFDRFLIENDIYDIADHFEMSHIPTYSKGNYAACLDHFCGNVSIIAKIDSFEIIQNVIDTSDHKPIRCVLSPVINSVDINSERLTRSGQKHLFPWKNSLFCELYATEIDTLFEADCSRSFDSSTDIDNFFAELSNKMLKCARKAEKSAGIYTSNGLIRGSFVRCNNSSEILRIVSEVRMLNQRQEDKSAYARKLKSDLRRLQRLSLFNKEKDDSFKIKKLLFSDRNQFGRQVKSYKRKYKKRASIVGNKPTPDDFVDFYRDLFSHRDRVSSSRHVEIADKVADYSAAITSNLHINFFTDEDVYNSINKLKVGKSAGFDGISNEFFKFANFTNLVSSLKGFFNGMVSIGVIPESFNTSLLIPIPKKGELNFPSDYRPISVSTSAATLFEILILDKIPWIKNSDNNQFGYKDKTSCKAAFFVANETSCYYKFGGTNMHSVSLNAAKAFDKLWRNGLFFKLIDHINPIIWRILYCYYKYSYIIVSVEGFVTTPFLTSEGVKQGGILSPFLFNFFIDDLLIRCKNLGIGATIGNYNTCILAYCDDLLIQASNETHMNRLLVCCHEYASEWKLEFNATKSVSYSLTRTILSNFELGNVPIPTSNGFVYLGLPIGDDKFSENFFMEKMKKCEKSLFSLRFLGCRRNALDPNTIAFIFKQFCQSTLNFGLEFCFIKNSILKCLNTRQNILIKNVLGIKYFARIKPLLNELKIETIEQLYYKHKIFGARQLLKNSFTNKIFSYINRFYKNVEHKENHSFISQLQELQEFTSYSLEDHNVALSLIDNRFQCNDLFLRESIRNILNDFNIKYSFLFTDSLNDLLKIIF